MGPNSWTKYTSTSLTSGEYAGKKVSGLSHSKILEMKVNVLGTLAGTASTWMAGYREELILILRYFAELTNASGIRC